MRGWRYAAALLLALGCAGYFLHRAGPPVRTREDVIDMMPLEPPPYSHAAEIRRAVRESGCQLIEPEEEPR